MIKWCVEGEEIAFSGKGPTSCFCNTFILPVPGIYLFICALFTVLRTLYFIPFRSIDSKTAVFLRVLQGMSICQGVLIIAFMANDKICGSILFSTFVQATAWVLCAFLLEREAWRLPYFVLWTNKRGLKWTDFQSERIVQNNTDIMDQIHLY